MTYWHIVDCIFVYKYLLPHFYRITTREEDKRNKTERTRTEIFCTLAAPFFVSYLIHNVLKAYGYAL